MTNLQKKTNSNRHIHTLPISMCGNDNQRLKLNKNSVGQHQLHINTNRPVAKGFLKAAPQTPVDHFALIGLLFKPHGKWILRKVIKIVTTRCHILKLKCTKFVFSRGSAPNRWGSLRRYPRPPSRLGRGILHPHSPPLDAFGVSVSAPLASKLVYPRLCFFSNSTPD